MDANVNGHHLASAMTLQTLPRPAKALATCILLSLGIGMFGALGQIVVHDIIPTFFTESEAAATAMHAGGHGDMEATSMPSAGDRGDLFAELSVEEENVQQPFYKQEQFVWTLKWSHIHLFGMSMIFTLLGAVTIWLDASIKLRTWLVVLPFVGVMVDILAMWLKAFVSPVFFWLHVPGGGLFAIIFGYVSLRALKEMWLVPGRSRVQRGA